MFREMAKEQQKQAEFSAISTVQILDRALFSGIAWTVLFRWSAQILSWASMLYVARILSPGDFGLVAMATIPIGLARMVEDFGLDAVLVQDRTLSQEQLGRLAGAALLLGGSLMGLFFILSVPIATYFREPAVAAIVCALSLTFIADSIQVLPRSMLQRELRFRALAGLDGLNLAVAAVTVTIAATFGLGHWALICNTLLSSAIVTLTACILSPYRPSWPRDLKALTRALGAGWYMIVSRAAWYGYSKFDSTIIGRILGKDALGVFGFATTFSSFLVVEVLALYSKVVPGTFSAVQADQLALCRYFLMLTEAIAYLTLPMCFGLALTADDFVRLALGPQWEAVIAPLRILCIYMVCYSCQTLISHVLLWTGHFRANMWLNIFALGILPLCFFIGVHHGITGVSWGWVIGFPLSLIPAYVLVFRILNLRLAGYFYALYPAFTACLVMSAVVILLRHFLPESWTVAVRLTIQSACGAMTYLVVIFSAFRLRIHAIYRAVRGAYASEEKMPVVDAAIGLVSRSS
jgi:teichuronic acid exporter